MTRLPSITVIVPTRDRPALLRRALAGIADQTYRGEIETIVVFDQSDPDRSLRGPGVRTMRNARSSGLAGARNTGILASDADLIAFCDDDDEWMPEKLEAQVELLASRPEVEVVTTGIVVAAAGRFKSRVLERDRVTLADLVRSRVMEAHPSTFLVRRAALDAIGLVDEDIPGSYGEDYDWLLRAARRADVAVVPRPLVTVHWHAQSFFAERWRTIVEALDFLLAKHPELRADPTGRARIEAQQAFAHAALGDGRPARRAAIGALRRDRSQKRAYLALLTASGLVRTEQVLRLAAAAGRGV